MNKQKTSVKNNMKLATVKVGMECPLRKPVKHVKKSVLTIYMTIMLDAFSHSSWNGW